MTDTPVSGFALIRAFWANGPTDSTQRHVLTTLAIHASPDGLAWPSVGTIAACCGISERHTRRALAALEAEGFIESLSKTDTGRRGGGGFNRRTGIAITTVYRFHPRVDNPDIHVRVNGAEHGPDDHAAARSEPRSPGHGRPITRTSETITRTSETDHPDTHVRQRPVKSQQKHHVNRHDARDAHAHTRGDGYGDDRQAFMVKALDAAGLFVPLDDLDDDGGAR